MTAHTRALTADDARQAWHLGAEAFGYSQAEPDPLPDPTKGGRVAVGAFVGGELVAKASALGYRSWWGGREVQQAAVASVAVRLEERGAGLLTPVMEELLRRARERGDVIATLFATAPAIYRRFGFETVTSYDQVEVATRDLLDARAPEGVQPARLRRGDASDREAVRELWRTWSSRHDGTLTRTGAHFPDDEDGYAAALGRARLTLAEEDGQVTGYATWTRRGGYHGGTTDVDDLVATTPGAAVALLRGIGSSHSVSPTTTLWTSGADPLRTFLPSVTWRGVDCRPYGLAVLDVVGAFEARGYAPHLRADLRFEVTGPGPSAGSYALRIAEGRARCERLDAGQARGIRVMSARSLALTYAGALPSADQRIAGLLSGTGDDDEVWDGLRGGSGPHVRDYF